MDYRAHHLQDLAQTAAKKAIRTGTLIRQPCEVCGEKAQAHHDSYHPDRWLDVRWLCGRHHREWHMMNDPEWPTIFDFHPSDIDRVNLGGRPPKPWFKTQTKMWYVTVGRKQVNLGRNKKEAFRRFEEMQAEKKKLTDQMFGR